MVDASSKKEENDVRSNGNDIQIKESRDQSTSADEAERKRPGGRSDLKQNFPRLDEVKDHVEKRSDTWQCL